MIARDLFWPSMQHDDHPFKSAIIDHGIEVSWRPFMTRWKPDVPRHAELAPPWTMSPRQGA